MATKERTHLYEGMYIINATLSEEAVKKAIDRISESISSRGGEVHKVHDWGRRKLAYEINGSKQGYYFLLYFSMPAQMVAEMWHDYHLNEDLVRFMTKRAEEVKEKIEFKPLVQE